MITDAQGSQLTGELDLRTPLGAAFEDTVLHRLHGVLVEALIDHEYFADRREHFRLVQLLYLHTLSDHRDEVLRAIAFAVFVALLGGSYKMGFISITCILAAYFVGSPRLVGPCISRGPSPRTRCIEDLK